MKLVPVEGPLVYLDLVTDDKRLLTADGLVMPTKPVPIYRTSVYQPFAVGQIDRFQRWGDVLWAYGVLELEGAKRVHASVGVMGSPRIYCGTLIWDEWTPASVAPHDVPSSPWADHETYLEVSK